MLRRLRGICTQLQTGCECVQSSLRFDVLRTGGFSKNVPCLRALQGHEVKDVRNEDSQYSKNAEKGASSRYDWGSRSQDLKSALEIGMKDEMRRLDARLSMWSREKLEKTGLAIFDLQATRKGMWYGNILVHLELKKKEELPFHHFLQGDVVYLSNSNSRIGEGGVVDVDSNWIRITLQGDLGGPHVKHAFRLDMGTNTTTFQRCISAVEELSSSTDDEGESFQSILRGGLFPHGRSIMDEASRCPSWAQSLFFPGQLKNGITEAKRRVGKLNPSQINAIEMGLQRTLTMWQGPPGTGKTHTVCAYVVAALKCIPEGSKVLVTAPSNAAVDNIALGLKKLEIDTIRWGQPVRVHKAVRSMTLPARVIDTVLWREAAKLREKLEDGEEGLDEETWSKIKEKEQEAKEEIITSVPVVVTTCISSGDAGLVGRNFAVAVLDEANQATEPESLVALLKNVESAVIVGDSQQLDPTPGNLQAGKLGLYIDMNEKMQSLGMEPLLLDTQYRMHPHIAEFPINTFYEGKIINAVIADDSLPVKGVPWQQPEKPVLFINQDGEETVSVLGDRGKSYINKAQSEVALDLAESILSANRSLLPKDIGIMTSYPAQAQYIRQNLLKEREKLRGVVVDSVEGFQGREKEVIIFSTVRSNKNRSIGFVGNKRRTNVALTRAKRGLIVIGSKATLSACKAWKSWFSWLQKTGPKSHKQFV